MSKVYSRFNTPKRKPTATGSNIRTTYKWVKDEYGKEYLERGEDIDRQAEIESYADECDIKNIVARAAIDPTFAMKLAEGTKDGSFMDTTEYPENIHELKKMANAAGKTIEEISEQLKQKQEQKPEEKTEAKNENEPE